MPEITINISVFLYKSKLLLIYIRIAIGSFQFHSSKHNHPMSSKRKDSHPARASSAALLTKVVKVCALDSNNTSMY